MHTKSKIRILGAVLCFLISALSFSYSVMYCLPTVEFNNAFSTSVVDIHLTEYQTDENGKESEYDNSIAKVVLPGDVISQTPRITNDAEDCYIRVKLVLAGGNEDWALSEECLNGIGTEWIKNQDGYYYYNQVLPSGESVDFYKSVMFPTDFPESVQGKELSLEVKVEAIQSANFEPDWDSSEPWGDVEIVQCENKGQYDLAVLKQSEDQSNFSAVYYGGAEAFVTNHENIFQNFNGMMPGDERSSVLDLSNSSDKEINIYFQQQLVEDLSIYDVAGLTISMNENGNDRVLYDGTIADCSGGTDPFITLKPGEAASMKYTIRLPKDADNTQSLQNCKIKWIFSTEEIDDSTVDQEDQSDNNSTVDKPVNSNPGNNSNGSTNTNNTNTDTTRDKTGNNSTANESNHNFRLPNTGISGTITYLLIAAVFALFGFFLFFRSNKKDKENERKRGDSQ